MRVGKATQCAQRITGCRPAEPDWRADLPAAWAARVVRPAFFSLQRDYEVAATRIVGFASEDQPCFCRYEALITRLCCDEDELWCEMPAYGEQITGWRLVDERWLVLRETFHGEDCQASRAFFAFADEMPR